MKYNKGQRIAIIVILVIFALSLIAPALAQLS